MLNCQSDVETIKPPVDDFYFGADLSYANQILDKNGVFKINGIEKDPYTIFSDRGTNLVRLRLWHTPTWTKDVYNGDGTQLYNDLKDVERSIVRSKAEGMAVLLDFHYSDNWADPLKQRVPLAWQGISEMSVLKDSIYQYTFKSLHYLKEKDLLPTLVQIGNETNCGMLFTDAPTEFPLSNVCNNQWAAAGEIYNSAIQAVRDVSSEIKIVLHVADPKNLDWWFSGITTQGQVTNFDVIGFSYYPLWHTTIAPSQLKSTLRTIKNKFNKDIILLETAYPWTTGSNDSYTNLFGSETPITGYPFTQQGQRDMLIALTKAIQAADGIGLIYWEPAWITSDLKDQWGTGSAWENCAFFNYDGNAHMGFDFMTFDYK
jgi:arabinogalactan endo-1,4-beta-galactosidase